MYKTFTLLGLCLLCVFMSAQDAFTLKDTTQQNTYAYTFVSEKKYNVIHELSEETIVPGFYQYKQGEPKQLAAGDIIIRFTERTIYINGLEGIEQFQVMSKYKAPVGYIFDLMDAAYRQAKLKVILDTKQHVDFIYLRTDLQGEHTFYLAQKDEQSLAADQSYFTPKDMYFVRSYVNLIDKDIYPYSYIEDASASDQASTIEKSQNMVFSFSNETINTPKGSFKIKEAPTFEYKLKGYPAVKSMIAIKLKGKPNEMYVFLNFKQQIEIIEIGNSRYFLLP